MKRKLITTILLLSLLLLLTGCYSFDSDDLYALPQRSREYRELQAAVEAALGSDFLRINKSTLVNLRQLDYVEPTLGGLMLLVLKNGCRDHISRKYLPAFKQYLGL